MPIAAYGLLPRNISKQLSASQDIVVTPPEDAPLSAAHWRLMPVLVIALVIDIMKPASLGFTIPGMVDEYQADEGDGVAGAVLRADRHRGRIDRLGRARRHLRPKGDDPAVGGDVRRHLDLRRDAVARLERRHVFHDGRGGRRHAAGHLRAARRDDAEQASRLGLVLVGGLGAVGGYFAASGFSALLQPIFSWRILWLLNLPTGLSLVVLGTLIPESAKFLLARGRREEARRVMERFGSKARKTTHAEACRPRQRAGGRSHRTRLLRQALRT